MTLPTLNAPLFENILKWAAKDDETVKEIAQIAMFAFPEFAGWGRHSQQRWAEEVRNGVCETAFCMAGQAVHQSGYILLMEDQSQAYNDNRTHFGAGYALPAPAGWSFKDRGLMAYESRVDGRRCWIDRNGTLIPEFGDRGAYIGSFFDGVNSEAKPIQRVSNDVLGLMPEEGDLFYTGNNTLGDLLRYAVMFATARGITLEVPVDPEVLDTENFMGDHTVEWYVTRLLTGLRPSDNTGYIRDNLAAARVIAAYDVHVTV